MSAPAGTAVAIGGGHGLARTLRALPDVVETVTAVVTAADDGGSSGRLRAEHDVIGLGDLGMALTALARDEAFPPGPTTAGVLAPGPTTAGQLAELLGHRFDRGELAGHSLGNLVLVALQQLCDGDILVALDRLARLLDIPGRVWPCTTMSVSLHGCTVGGGAPVHGQASLARSAHLERVWLEPRSPTATPQAVDAITEADLVVLGPGSLYTSLLPNLLVPGIARAIAAARGPVVMVANLREQPGETEGMTISDHLEALRAHVPDLRVDVLLGHAGSRPAGPGVVLDATDPGVADRVGRVELADLLDDRAGHAPRALAAALSRVLGAELPARVRADR